MQSDTCATVAAHVVDVLHAIVSKVGVREAEVEPGTTSSTRDSCRAGTNIASESTSAFGVGSVGW
jgi:hypothetical protein